MSIAGASPERQVEYLLSLNKINAQKIRDLQLVIQTRDLELRVASRNDANANAELVRRLLDVRLELEQEKFKNGQLIAELAQRTRASRWSVFKRWFQARWNCHGE